MAPPKISLLFKDKSMPALIFKPWLNLVTHMDDNGRYITSTQLPQMLVQNLNRIASKSNVMPGKILHCTTICIPIDLMLKANIPTNTQVWNSLSHLKYHRQREVTELLLGATTATCTRSATSVTRRSCVLPRAWVGPTTN